MTHSDSNGASGDAFLFETVAEINRAGSLNIINISDLCTAPHINAYTYIHYSLLAMCGCGIYNDMFHKQVINWVEISEQNPKIAFMGNTFEETFQFISRPFLSISF